MIAGFALHTDPVPLHFDDGGVVRIGNSRVPLDIVVEEHESGKAAEDIVQEYDTLALADVHAVIAYYLRHKDEVQAYLRQRQEEAGQLRAEIEAAQAPFPTRAELLARRQQNHAQNGQ